MTWSVDCVDAQRFERGILRDWDESAFVIRFRFARLHEPVIVAHPDTESSCATRQSTSNLTK